ncbi:TetR/AcrR family transcriptional regulator [Viridibacillus arvi]|uniref:HTH tetR-type domain-containing protein n=1 Tax=Viridibacillus arvi TaxID=263475 RepID=A0A0M0LH06_9BACL|nr:TetR/AcrR family transcriptional regulator [Viridibacillus arvi]KOO49963.1 hypothetical protein AMD00_16810 [Viridibacillus arvi]
MARERKFTHDELFTTTHLLLLRYGYEGFTFSLLAETLQVSRAAIYKQYMNKEELISNYMVSALQKVHVELKSIDQQIPLLGQLDELLTKVYKYKSLQQFFGIGNQIQDNGSELVILKKKILMQLQLEMRDIIQELIEQGKNENILNKEIPSDLILGFMLQSIATPNREGFAQEEWIRSIKELIFYGITKVK